MEIGKRIKAYRGFLALSQDDLAKKIFVSRQTISNWETDKTYPDIQSLIALSILFDVSLDELIKSDLEAIKMKISRNQANQKSDLHTKIMLISTVLSALSIGLVVAFPESNAILLVPLVLFLPGFWSSLRLEKFKKENDLKTYKEILAFSQNGDVNALREKRTGQKMGMVECLIVLAYGVATLIICIIAIAIVKFFKQL
ncbi:helix-turn-helix transcriptional regulator [Lactococcus piscium]|uniref:helix-turn-helix transcriptional regulator n=1 Tax=Pseudolactococcus carnosus TaxID=2749961 RepID=UPI001FB8DD4F|nr:helix-turn-helix transcriptional regulator [Lactococcus carnosus]MCJ1996759.1 helix-turn-helix transcriptional regulator [Lactococcus carnosus]